MKNQFYKSFRIWVKAVLICFCLVSFVGLPKVKGQDVFWGISGFGPLGGGSIYSINSDGTDYQQRHAFTPSPQLTGELLDIGDGFLYGISTGRDRGSIVRFSSDGSFFETIHSLALQPFGKLVLGSDNMLYGTAHHFANQSPVVIFKINPDGSGYEEIYNSNEAEFKISWNVGLKTAHNGFLYSLSPDGIFKISLDGSSISILETSSNDLSDHRIASLVQDEEGILYGFERSDNRIFHLYKIHPDAGKFEVLYAFEYEPGDSFEADLIVGAEGFLYGMFGQDSWDGDPTSGTVFQIGRDGTGFSVLHEFVDSAPSGSLVESNGNLYGIEVDEDRDGFLFRIDVDSGGFTQVLSLETFPSNSSLTLGSDSNLYGLFVPADRSIIFSIVLDDYSYRTIVAPTSDGSSPNNIVEGQDGYFYGTTVAGGVFGRGTFFRISPQGNDFQVLHHLEVTITKLIEGTDGDFYGIGEVTENSHHLFRITTEGLHSLREFPALYRDLLQDQEGFLYGIFVDLNEEASIFKISTDGNEFEILFSPSQQHPYRLQQGPFLLAQNVFIYVGARVAGSFDQNLIFRVNIDGSDFEVLRTQEDWLEDMIPGYFLEGSDGLIYGVLLDIEGGAPWLFSMQPDGSGFQSSQLPIPSFIYSLRFECRDGYLYGDGEDIDDPTTFLYRVAKDGTDASRIYVSEGGINPVGPFVLQQRDCPTPSSPEPIISDSLIAIGDEISVFVSITEEKDWLTATWHWGDGETSEASFTDTIAVGTHSYTQAGSYSITLVLTDDCGTATSPPVAVEVTDEAQPSTGSVKGIGMFASPRGAYVAKPQMRGMAHYSIHAKADNGKVSGTFQFKIADLQFRSSKYDQLIIEDNRAWLYGEGKIRGKGKYGFLLAMVDEEDSPNEKSYKKWKTRGKDKLRVKIWNISKDNRIVYDNQLGDSDDAVAVRNIERGTIIILEEVTSPGIELDKDFIIEQLKKIKAYPNPASDKIYIDLGDITPEMINTMLTDAYGTFEIRNLYRKMDGNLLEFDLSSLKHGTYYIRIQTKNGSQSIKILKK
ncbi:choice-of-anchor tandem repeat GloVer-containing protein [Litoribacter populi]|uniref:choice-of-anchor tandem repeat GloVer-containing protein n=1 Tax=Litoribacter populi TaxID=2598460 RepID=UPI00117DA690|nr:choice-of-anchor tandem repeat GloVer-containing protein [Litoribacter populi]